MTTTIATPPAAFTPRNWEAPEYDDVAPRDRYEIADGPTVGGIESTWDSVSGVWIAVDGYAGTGEGFDVDLNDAKRLRDDLTSVLDKIEDASTPTDHDALIAARTLLAVKSRSEITTRDMAAIREQLGIKPSALMQHLQDLVPEWRDKYSE